MPNQIESILATGRVQLVVGDVVQKNFGLNSDVLAEMVDNVTLIIHAAGNIGLNVPLKETVRDNCLPTLRLAQVASTFRNLSTFVYISTAAVNGFLPDGVVEEKIYHVGDSDAERQLSDILATGSTPGVAIFPWAYSFAKHLTERLLISRNTGMPLLIVRPTLIGPAISQPHPYYSCPGSCPASSYIQDYLTDPDSGVFHVSPKHKSGSNILDEIPVDLVSNLILLHITRGSTGIVHAGAQSYVPRSLSQLHDTIRAQLSPDMARYAFCYTLDRRIPEGHHTRFWRLLARDWCFSNHASKAFAEVRGPLSIALDDHDVNTFMMTRAKLIAIEVTARSRSKL
ncbi:male sterility protein-domain-containing protein [Mycena galopus ATCC 62051]|nr:male sterility protein-domain-containing protein [Mycena galopus ATCC 62051]